MVHMASAGSMHVLAAREGSLQHCMCYSNIIMINFIIVH